jgi:hypothetical protein
MQNLVARNHVVLQIEIHEDERDATFAALDAVGLTVVERLSSDYFATNIAALLEPGCSAPA